MRNNKKKILITDDSEINRSILSDMLKEEFSIIEAENGVQAISVLQKYGDDIALVLLDIVMPEMDGFEVLAFMNNKRWIENIPVIMITAENTLSYIERAYDLGVTDFISRPFDSRIVHRRVVNTIMLYSKQKKLAGLIADQIYEKEKNNNLMIEILSNIVEFRNGESGLHVLHIHVLTELILNKLVSKTDRYKLNHSDISLIGIASALHDIGKIVIPEEILNKPGRLTKEEFEIIKTHSATGSDMLKSLPFRQNELMVKVASEICRWHHERYDGKGYPDGLAGDDIPISAQVVALADVYDALVSKRVYKEAYDHEKAIQMIVDGECGAFNPLLIECLLDVADTIRLELKVNSLSELNKNQLRNIREELIKHEELFASERTLRLLEHERTKYSFFASMSNEVQFEYTVSPSLLTLSEFGAKKLGLPVYIMNPEKEAILNNFFPDNNLMSLAAALKQTTPQNPIIQRIFKTYIKGEMRWCKIIARSMWTGDEEGQYVGAIGKLVDITDEQLELSKLEMLAYHDMLTGLMRLEVARKNIEEQLRNSSHLVNAIAIIDIDYFKQVNDSFGHLYGNDVLKRVANKVTQNLNPQEIAARIGGDEFLLFMHCDSNFEERIDRMFNDLSNDDTYSISVSMGVSLGNGRDANYETLFHRADQALYAAKRAGRNTYRYYSADMKDMFNQFTPIDTDTKG